MKRLGISRNRPLYWSHPKPKQPYEKRKITLADWEHIASIILKVFTALIPFFYINGIAYNQGELSVFSVDTSFFGQSIEENLMSAFYGIM
jgi:hypothetical protein